MKKNIFEKKSEFKCDRILNRKDCVGVFSLKKLRVRKVKNLHISTLAAVTPDSR